jgi:S-adenosylmethionine hydrolase
MTPIITLLTDFGTADAYAGIMKGVILSLNPCAVIVDITHSIDPQDVIQAAYTLESAYKYFPEGAVHVVVVDPGVGSGRAILAVETKGHIFLAPNNGVLTLLFEENTEARVIRVENAAYFLPSVSRTFHGRDIFAPVAAHISRGIDISELGPLFDRNDLIFSDIRKPYLSENGELIGEIVSIDRFGNLITNIDEKSLEIFRETNPEILIAESRIFGLSESYAGVKPHQPLALIGSRGYLEISVNCGNAETFFSAGKRHRITVRRIRSSEPGA